MNTKIFAIFLTMVCTQSRVIAPRLLGTSDKTPKEKQNIQKLEIALNEFTRIRIETSVYTSEENKVGFQVKTTRPEPFFDPKLKTNEFQKRVVDYIENDVTFQSTYPVDEQGGPQILITEFVFDDGKKLTIEAERNHFKNAGAQYQIRSNLVTPSKAVKLTTQDIETFTDKYVEEMHACGFFPKEVGNLEAVGEDKTTQNQKSEPKEDLSSAWGDRSTISRTFDLGSGKSLTLTISRNVADNRENFNINVQVSNSQALESGQDINLEEEIRARLAQLENEKYLPAGYSKSFKFTAELDHTYLIEERVIEVRSGVLPTGQSFDVTGIKKIYNNGNVKFELIVNAKGNVDKEAVNKKVRELMPELNDKNCVGISIQIHSTSISKVTSKFSANQKTSEQKIDAKLIRGTSIEIEGQKYSIDLLKTNPIITVRGQPYKVQFLKSGNENAFTLAPAEKQTEPSCLALPQKMTRLLDQDRIVAARAIFDNLVQKNIISTSFVLNEVQIHCFGFARSEEMDDLLKRTSKSEVDLKSNYLLIGKKAIDLANNAFHIEFDFAGRRSVLSLDLGNGNYKIINLNDFRPLNPLLFNKDFVGLNTEIERKNLNVVAKGLETNIIKKEEVELNKDDFDILKSFIDKFLETNPFTEKFELIEGSNVDYWGNSNKGEMGFTLEIGDRDCKFEIISTCPIDERSTIYRLREGSPENCLDLMQPNQIAFEYKLMHPIELNEPVVYVTENFISEPIIVQDAVVVSVKQEEREPHMTGGVMTQTGQAAYLATQSYIDQLKKKGVFGSEYELKIEDVVESTFQSTNPPSLSFTILFNGNKCRFISVFTDDYSQYDNRDFELSRNSCDCCLSLLTPAFRGTRGAPIQDSSSEIQLDSENELKPIQMKPATAQIEKIVDLPMKSEMIVVNKKYTSPIKKEHLAGGIQHQTGEEAYQTALGYIAELKNHGGLDQTFDLRKEDFLETTFQSTYPPRVSFKIRIHDKECEYISIYDFDLQRTFILTEKSDKLCPNPTAKSLSPKVTKPAFLSTHLQALIKETNSKLQSKPVEKTERLQQNQSKINKELGSKLPIKIESEIQGSKTGANKATLNRFKGSVFAVDVNFDGYFLSSYSENKNTKTNTRTTIVNGKSEVQKIVTVTTKFVIALGVNNETCVYTITEVTKTGETDSVTLTGELSDNCKSILAKKRSCRVLL